MPCGAEKSPYDTHFCILPVPGMRKDGLVDFRVLYAVKREITYQNETGSP